MIPQSRPDLRAGDFSYVRDLVASRQIARGRWVSKLERRFARHLDVPHATAVSSGTAALHVTLVALGMKKGAEVIVPSYACAALLHAVHQAGATPVPIDINPDTLNPDARHVRSAVTRRTGAIIVTHTFGFPVSIRELLDIGPPVIEDCAQAIGATVDGRPVGSLGQAAVFSLYATKPVTAGEGGIVCTRDSRLAKEIIDLTTPDDRATYRVRFNYKLSDLSAGLADRQFGRLAASVRRRRSLARRYLSAFRSTGALFQQALEDTEPTHYRFIVRTPRAAAIIRASRAAGIYCDRPVFKPLHEYLGMSGDRRFGGTEDAWRTTVSIPLYPSLTAAEVGHILDRVGGILARLR